ncbi:MAG: M28 family peptidase [Janthinobacterium lividum]
MTRHLLRSVAFAALLFAAAPVAAQDFSAQAISDQVRVIASDEFAGRYPGTEGEEKTLAWLQAQYEAMGLEPGGPNGQWLQTIELLRLTPVGEPTASVKAADGSVKALAPDNGLLLRAMNSNGKGQVQDAPVVFVGYGITAPERSWDDYGNVDVRGKVVVVLSGEPDGELFNGQYRTHYSSAGYKQDEAFRRGAVAVLSVAGGDMGRQAQFNSRQRTLSPGSAELQLTGTMSSELARSWGIDLDSVTANTPAGVFKPQDLNVRFSASAEETKEILRTSNFIARLPGTERPDETIVFSAHWDHVGVNHNAPGEDKIFNGAWDNASGTVGVVEMARQFAKAGPAKRSIVFLHVTAEEQGLLGAYAYAADPVYPLETTVANINIDMLPITGLTHDLPIFGKGQNTLEDDLQVLAQTQNRYVSDDGQPEQGFYFRSDHFAFARAGVPALMPWHGIDWVEGGKEVGKKAWDDKFRADYHRPTDEWSEELKFDSAVQNLTLLYRLARDLADGNGWPQWKPMSEFGQVRARTNTARQ